MSEGQGLTDRFASLNPFSGGSNDDADAEAEEDYGEEVDITSVAGGGHSARQTDITKHQLHVSQSLRSFIVGKGILSPQDVDLDSDQPSAALQALIAKPHISVPPHVTDRSHPLPEYFISSSHNTYLIAHQLYGTSSASAYETALRAGARCVEIDAWDDDDNKEEPKVTHGFTLVSHIPFRAVCETIRDVVDQEATEAVNEQGYRAAPILLSLENHCSPEGQMRLVQIMRETWGDRLLSKAVRDKGTEEQQGGEHVTLEELGSKITVIVEYHLPDESSSDSGSSSSINDSSDEEVRDARKKYRENKKAAPTTIIIPELAELGVYAQSVKPVDNSWFEQVEMRNGPHHHLINVSETGLADHMPKDSEGIARHNAHHLMRVFPKGTRISSRNLKPVPFWGLGAQICALNWQTFGASMQLNEALFSGTDGYVLKPAALRSGGDGKLTSERKKRLRLYVGGASDIPLPKGEEADNVRPYLTCLLVHPVLPENKAHKRKTAPYRQHKLTGFLHNQNPPITDPIWDEVLEWEYEDNELAFLRMLIKSDASFSRNPSLAVAAVRIIYASPGWRFIRMLDLKGRETKCSILVRFEVEDL